MIRWPANPKSRHEAWRVLQWTGIYAYALQAAIDGYGGLDGWLTLHESRETPLTPPEDDAMAVLREANGVAT